MKFKVVFSAISDLFEVKRQMLQVMKDYPGCEFVSLFMPPDLVKYLGVNESISMMLNTFKNHEFYIKAKTVEEYKDRLRTARYELEEYCDKVLILDSGLTPGIQKEIETFSNGKVLVR